VELGPLIDNMGREANRYVDLLRQAAIRGETDVVHRAAHSLKGLASQFGALRLAAAAAWTEQTAKRGENIEPLLAEVEAMAGEALSALSDWRRNAAQPGKSAPPPN